MSNTELATINQERFDEVFRVPEKSRPFAMTIGLVRNPGYPNRDAWITVQPLLAQLLVGYESLNQEQIISMEQSPDLCRSSRPRHRFNYEVLRDAFYAARQANRLATLSRNQVQRAIQEYKQKKAKTLDRIEDESSLRVHHVAIRMFEDELVDGPLAGISMPS